MTKRQNAAARPDLQKYLQIGAEKSQTKINRPDSGSGNVHDNNYSGKGTDSERKAGRNKR